MLEKPNFSAIISEIKTAQELAQSKKESEDWSGLVNDSQAVINLSYDLIESLKQLNAAEWQTAMDAAYDAVYNIAFALHMENDNEAASKILSLITAGKVKCDFLEDGRCRLENLKNQLKR